MRMPRPWRWPGIRGPIAIAADDDDDSNDNDNDTDTVTGTIDFSVLSSDGSDRFQADGGTGTANSACDNPLSAPLLSESRAESMPAAEASEMSFLGMPFKSVALLNLVAVIWGTQHAVIKGVIDDADSSAASFTLARFGLAALLAAPFTPRISLPCNSSDAAASSSAPRDDAVVEASVDQSANCSALVTDEESRLAWRYGLELGAYMFLGYAFQAVGLQTTTASRSGFLLYLNVKLVPFFAWVLLGRRISCSTWISAFAAFSGTALLALDNASRGTTDVGMFLNVGDLWSIAAAAMSAMFILRMEKATAEVKEASQLNAASLWLVAAAALIWAVAASYWEQLHRQVDFATEVAGEEISYETGGQALLSVLRRTWDEVFSMVTHHPLPLLYLGGVATTLANYFQSKGQRNIPAERAAILYAMDPVYGALFAHWWLGEKLGPIGFVGAGIITVAAATNAFLDLGTSMTSSSGDDADGAMPLLA